MLDRRGQLLLAALGFAECSLPSYDYTLVIFEAWILFVILISLGGPAHVPALAGCPLSSVMLWCISILTVLITGGALFVWLDVRRWLQRSSSLTTKDPTT